MKVLNDLVVAGNASAKNLSGTNTGDQDLSGLATKVELDLKAMQNPGVCQKLPIKPIDIVIDSTNLTLTIATINNGQTISALNPIRVFTDGSGIISKWEKSTPQTVSFTKTNGVWYFHFDNTGNLVATQTPWTDFNIIAPIYRFYLNDQLDNANMITVRAWEAHLNDQSASDHEWKHAQGTIHESGFDIVCTPLVTGTPNASGINTCISLTTGKNSDDGLEYTVTNTQTPTLGFQQDLGITTASSLTISNGALFKVRTNDAQGRLSFLNATRFPFAWDNAKNRPQYITTNGTRTLVTDNRWFVYYVYALQDDKVGEAIKIVSAETEFTSLALAQSHKWENLQSLYATLNDKEIRPLYKCIFYADNSGGGAFNVAIKYTVLREVTDIRRQQVTISASAGGSVLASNVVTTPTTNLTGTNAETKFTEVDSYITNHSPWTKSGHTGTANKLAKWDSSNVAQVSGITELDNGNVGIGESSPTEKVEILGNIKLTQPTNNKVISTGTSLTLSQLNDAFGETGLEITNRYNQNGAVFYNKTLDLIDFIFRTSTNYQATIRLEHRSSELRCSGNTSEFQVAYSGDLSHALGNAYSVLRGKIFIGSTKTNASSKLHISASDGSANTAQLKLDASRLLSTKEVNTIENDGLRLCQTDLNLKRSAFVREDALKFYQETSYYNTGTISLSGTTITGVGTTFTSLMVGSKIVFSNGEVRDITGYTDATHLTIDRTTIGTLSGVSFNIYLRRLFDDGANLVVTNNDGSTFNISSGGSGTPTSRQIIANATVGSIIGGGDLTADRTLTLSGDAVNPGNLKMYSTNVSGVKGWNSRSYIPLQYNLLEDVNNNSVYFYSCIQANANTTSVRSGNASNGLGIAYGASPIILPQSGTIIGATFTVVGAAVANGTVTYPCTLRTTLYNVGWTTEGTSISNIDCSIPNSSTPVGTYSVASTNGTFTTSGLSIAVTAGQPLALKWIPQTGASGINIIRNVIVTLWFIPN